MPIFTGCSSDNDDDDQTVYTVTFETDGGSPPPSSQRVEKGSTATAPSANPTKAGYVFVFWHLSGATTAYNFQTPVNGDITLYAKWQEEKTAEYWKVTWNLNGGSWPSGDNHATQILKDGTLAEPAAPTKVGSTFDGWYKESALTNKVTFPYDASNVTADFTLYAKWEDAGKAGYFGTWRDSRFEEWDQFTIGADRIVMLFRSGNSITIGNLAWTEISSQNNFAADYPNGYKVGGTVTKLNGINFIKEDKSGNAGVGDRVALNTYISADRKSIVIGIWSSKNEEEMYGPYNISDVGFWQVTWNLNGGTWPAADNHDEQAAKDGMLAVPASPTKTNNNFAGWYTDASLSNLVLFPYNVSTATGNITFYAKWMDSSPSVTLKVTVSPGIGFYTSITAMRVSSGSPSQYSIPTSIGTHTVKVSPGTYRIFYSYWACPTVNCMSSGYSSNFTVSSEQTKNISLVGSAVGL
jgi:uncharacterized repeat protein (TIGR02543 family)